jgi:hypothetical protein
MASDAEVVLAIAGAFAHCERPEHFVRNYNHCDECAQPDQLLRARDRETLCVEDVSSASNLYLGAGLCLLLSGAGAISANCAAAAFV